MTARVEFFFDLSSPWTCLAFHNLPGVLERAGASARYRPILVGGVFNAVNPAVYAAREQADNRRLQHSWKVLKDYLEAQGLSDLIGSRDATRSAFQNGLIEDGQAWMDMIKARDLTLHTYNQEVAENIEQDTLTRFYPAFVALAERFSALTSQPDTE